MQMANTRTNARDGHEENVNATNVDKYTGVMEDRVLRVLMVLQGVRMITSYHLHPRH